MFIMLLQHDCFIYSLLYLLHLGDLIIFVYFASRLWSHLPSLSQSAISSTASLALHLMF